MILHKTHTDQLNILHEWSWSHQKPAQSQVFGERRERRGPPAVRANISQPSISVRRQFCMQLSCSSRSSSWWWAAGDVALWTLCSTLTGSSPKLPSYKWYKTQNVQELTQLLNYKCIILLPIRHHSKQLPVGKAVTVKTTASQTLLLLLLLANAIVHNLFHPRWN